MAIDTNSQERLMGRARKILDSLKADSPPLFIEFAGTPKSGKSTCIDIVHHFFRRAGYKILAPTEGASKRTPYYLKEDWMAFNAWSACYALSYVLEGAYHSDKYHLVILDRGLFDALVWFELLFDREDITSKDRDKIHQFLLIEKWRSKISGVFLFRTDAETSISRENQNQLTTEPGRAMNPDAINKLNRAYDTVREKYSNLFADFTNVDTSGKTRSTPQSTAFEVAERILGYLEGRS